MKSKTGRANINFHNCDNMVHMKTVNDNHYDIGILDPEWGVGASKPSKKPNKAKQKNGKTLSVKQPTLKDKEWDNKPVSKEWGDEIFRITKNQIIWGANFLEWAVGETFKPPRRSEFNEFIKKYPYGWIIWDKMNGNSDQWDCELAWTSFNRPTIIHEYLWAGMMQGSKLNGKIQEGNKKLNEKRIHQTQKPIQLCKWQLNTFVNKGDSIYDSNGGAAGLAIASWDLGFDLDIIEIDKEYFDTGWTRFETHTSQTQLF